MQVLTTGPCAADVNAQDEIIAWVAAQEDGTNAGFIFGTLDSSRLFG